MDQVQQKLLQKYSYQQKAVDDISAKLSEIFELMNTFSNHVLQQEEMT